MSSRRLSTPNPLRGRPVARPKPPTLLRVEGMEDRTVPTVVFQPHFGAETIAPGSTNDALQSPTVQMIFAGGYWNTTAGSQDRATIISQTQALVNSPYFTGLTQYGSDGKVRLGTTYTDPTGIAPGFSTANLQTYLQGQITSNPVTPFPAVGPTAANTNIYVVVTPPGESSNQAAAGYNVPLNYTMPSFLGGGNRVINAVWAGTTATSAGGVNMIQWGDVISHELAETVSDPNQTGIAVNPPPGLQSNLVASGRDQIGDNEPAAPRYSYNLNGVSVSPYWSARDQAFIVPDGSRQNFYVSPVWAGATGSQYFTGQYDLSLVGDQLGTNYNDQITVNGSNATMNGETVGFNSGQLRNVGVNGRGGSNAVLVKGVDAGESLSITNATPGNSDAVTVGTGSLSAIQGAVNVSNSSGATSLYVDDRLDTTGRFVSVNNHSIGFSGSAAVNYDPGSLASNGTRDGVTSLAFRLGTGQDHVYVDGVSPLTPVYGFAQANDVFSGPAAGQIYRLPS